MKKRSENNISAEVLAAYLDGNATMEESKEILHALSEDAELRELLHISHLVDTELGLMSQECEYIPMTAMAATCNEENYCSLECEKYILRKFHLDFDEQELLQNALQNGWQKTDGTALHNVGRHLETRGFVVTRQYKSTIKDIANALDANKGVIVAIDGGELLGNRTVEIREDILIGQIPDHTVVVLSYDAENKTITLYDPNSSNAEDTYSVEQFEDAWNDSKNYLVTINSKDMKEYNPQPIDLSKVELPEELNELREALAENAHDVWAVERMAQGWSYGAKRDDDKKETPCMVPYSQLPESEKKFDRDMAESSLKLVKAVGYDIIKKEDTELYRLLRQRLLNAKEEFHCPHCGGLVYKYQVFCDTCGEKLDIDWNIYK